MRGINVGVKYRIKMDALRLSVESAGMENVTTHIQSGNILFSSDLSLARVQALLEGQFKADFDYDLPLFVYGVDELRAIVAASPYRLPEGNPDMRLFVALLREPPSAEQSEALQKAAQNEGDIALTSTAMYWLVDRSQIQRSKVMGLLGKPKFGLVNTTRYLHVLQKLIELS